MNILLILGSWSTERDVSLNTGAMIEKALLRLGHTVFRFDPERSLNGLIAAAKKADFAFIALHGAPGEDGLIQAMLDTVGCPYQGSGPAGSFLALNKAAAKELLRQNGLPTPDWVLLPRRPEPGWTPPFAFPLFIKSNIGGSSLGLERVTGPEGLDAALDRLFSGGGEYIVEPAVDGVEVTCGVLESPEGGIKALPPILIQPKTAAREGEFFDYVAKYTPGAADEICPAPLPEAVTARVQELSLAAHRILGLADYSRSDFIVRGDGEPVFLEVNTLPGMTANSLLPKAAAVTGMSFEQLIGHLITLGLRKSASGGQGGDPLATPIGTR